MDATTQSTWSLGVTLCSAFHVACLECALHWACSRIEMSKSSFDAHVITMQTAGISRLVTQLVERTNVVDIWTVNTHEAMCPICREVLLSKPSANDSNIPQLLARVNLTAPLLTNPVYFIECPMCQDILTVGTATLNACANHLRNCLSHMVHCPCGKLVSSKTLPDHYMGDCNACQCPWFFCPTTGTMADITECFGHHRLIDAVADQS